MGEWIRVATASECPPGNIIERLAGDRVVAIANVGGKWFAIDGICPHQGGPIGQGTLCGTTVTCPWHGWQFDVTNGRHCTSATVRQDAFEATERDGEVLVRLRTEADSGADRP